MSGGLSCTRWAVLCASLLCGCSGREEASSARGLPARVVAFAQPELVITRLDLPVELPVTAGSAPAMDLIKSDDPAVVRIDQSGRAVALAPGRATLSSATGASKLRVVVRLASRLRLEPARLTLSPGERKTVRAFLNDAEVPPGSLTWQMSNPRRAAVSQGVVQAGDELGIAVSRAALDGAQGDLTVEVVPRARPLLLQITQAVLARGKVERISTNAAAGVPVVWQSSDERILKPLRDGLFYGVARGRAEACARAGGQEACATIDVSEWVSLSIVEYP